MNKEQLHKLVAESTGNESNICQIYAIRDGRTVYDDCWHGFKTDDAMNVNSVTKGVVALLAGIALDRGGRAAAFLQLVHGFHKIQQCHFVTCFP